MNLRKRVVYLFRLDDACPTMNFENWDRIFNIFDKYDVKPIVAIIPDNQDKNNILSDFDKTFWMKVESWKSKGYFLALHGLNHVYTTKESGLIGINKFSEFAGVSYELQRSKILSGLEIFKIWDIEPQIWVAPGHSFDKNTLRVLRDVTNISIISDGFSIYPFKLDNFFWLPCQLWGPREMRRGVWTICYHPNTMNDSAFELLETFLRNNSQNCLETITTIMENYNGNKRNYYDYIYQLKTIVRMKSARVYNNLKKMHEKYFEII